MEYLEEGDRYRKRQERTIWIYIAAIAGLIFYIWLLPKTGVCLGNGSLTDMLLMAIPDIISYMSAILTHLESAARSLVVIKDNSLND